MDAVLIEINLVTVTCCACGIPFGIPDYHRRQLLEKGGDFYCPNGHCQHFTNPEIPLLKKQLKEAERQAQLHKNWYEAEQDDHQRTRRKLAATKGILTKTKKRIANGVCPCCNRHFANLQHHIETKHPDYSESEADSPVD